MVGIRRFLCSSDRSFHDDVQDLHGDLPAVQADVPDRASTLQHCAVPRTKPFPRSAVRCTEGDSAGANPALALVRYLIEHRSGGDIPSQLRPQA